MDCPACGSVNVDGSESCFSCGRQLVASSDRGLRRGSVLAARYELLSPLGRGGMGMVYKAHDKVLDETVAIKVLRSELANAPDIARRFRSEIKLARRVTHRNVCRIHEYGADGDLNFISMEYVDGIDLKRVLRERGRFPVGEALDLSIQICGGLQAIHDVGIVHRDLKTANLMRDSSGAVKLMDFGIAKQTGMGEGLTAATSTGQIIGTPEYMSPEQARGERVDARSDLYALGVVLFEMFTGSVPFRGDTPIAIILKHIHDPPPLDAAEMSSIPPGVVSLLRLVLSKEPSQRGSADEMRRALESLRTEFKVLPTAGAVAVAPATRSAAALAPAPRRGAAPTPVPMPTATPTPTPAATPVPTVAPAAATVASARAGPTASPTPAPVPVSAKTATSRQQPAVHPLMPPRAHAASPAGSQRLLLGLLATGVVLAVALGGFVVYRFARGQPPVPQGASVMGLSPSEPRPATVEESAVDIGASGGARQAQQGTAATLPQQAERVAEAQGTPAARPSLGPTPKAAAAAQPPPLVSLTGRSANTSSAIPAPTSQHSSEAPLVRATPAPTTQPPLAQAISSPEPVVRGVPTPESRPSQAPVTSAVAPVPSPTLPAAPAPRPAGSSTAGGTPGPALPVARGLLSLEVKPEAEISIDGTPMGRMKVLTVPLDAGLHNVVFTHPKYQPLMRKVEIRAEDKTRLTVDMKDEALPLKK